MNNPSVMPDLAKVLPFEPKKHLLGIAGKFLANGVDYIDEQSVYDLLAKECADIGWEALIKQTCQSIGKEAIKAHSTPKLSSNDDWIGYGGLIIRIPSDGKLVSVSYARYDALDIRKINVAKNRDQIVKSATLEIQRIDQIQSMMMKMEVDTAGPALKVLAMNKFL